MCLQTIENFVYKHIVRCAAAGGLVIITVPLLIYAYNFGFSISMDQAHWSAVGSYMSGIAGALLSFLSVLFVAFTLKKNIADQKVLFETTQKGAFEQTYFYLIELFHANEKSQAFCSGTDDNLVDESANGKRFFSEIKEHFFRTDGLNLGGTGDTIPKAAQAYEAFYDRYSTELGHFFRGLYNVINYLDSSPIPDEDKQRYANILMSNISNDQLILLMFNLISKHGRIKFLPLAKKYGLLDNTHPNSLIEKSICSLYIAL